MKNREMKMLEKSMHMTAEYYDAQIRKGRIAEWALHIALSYVDFNDGTGSKAHQILVLALKKVLKEETQWDIVDLPPFLTQSVKTQNPLNGELSHGIISQAVHQGVQAGRGTAAGSRGIVGRGGGTEDRSAGFGDRFFEGVLAAHRGTADAAGIDWKSAVYRKVAEEATVGRRLSIERMVELGRVSRSGFYR